MATPSYDAQALPGPVVVATTVTVEVRQEVSNGPHLEGSKGSTPLVVAPAEGGPVITLVGPLGTVIGG